MRRWVLLVVVLLVVLCGVAAALWWSHKENAVDGAPISVSLGESGSLGFGGLQFVVQPDGRAKLIEGFPKDIRREFTVSKAQLGELKRIVLKERFFELRDEYGELVPDGSTTTLRIVWGKQAKTVSINYLMNWVESSPEKLREPTRAMHVLELVSSWYEDPRAEDEPSWDEILRDAAKRRGR